MYLQLKNGLLSHKLKQRRRKKKKSNFQLNIVGRPAFSRHFLENAGLKKNLWFTSFSWKKDKIQDYKNVIIIKNRHKIQKILKRVKEKKPNVTFSENILMLKRVNDNVIKILDKNQVGARIDSGKKLFFAYREDLWKMENNLRHVEDAIAKARAEKKTSIKDFNFFLKKQWKKKKLKNKSKKYLRFTNIKKNNKNNLSFKKLIKIKNYFLKNTGYKKTYKRNFSFIIHLYIKKFVFSCKLFFYNIYIYIISKILKKELKNNFFKNFGNIKINCFQISLKTLTAKIVVRYLQATLQNKYNIWFGLRKVIVDLNKRILAKNIKAYKILFCGRFKRELRATYIWRKNGRFLISNPRSGIDYEVAFYRSKYGLGAIKVWLTAGEQNFRYFKKIYPAFKAFFFLDKKKYFYLKKNDVFFNWLIKYFFLTYSFFNLNYIKNAVTFLLYTFLYTNIFIKQLDLNDISDLKGIYTNFKKILIPQYFLYKIHVPNFWHINYLKIKPYIDFNFLKKLNIRNSYKLNIINKEKKLAKKWVKLKKIKYHIQFLKI